jgi:hypothetical protein
VPTIKNAAMDLMVPSIGLILWMLIAFALLAVIIIAIKRLINDDQLPFSIKLLCGLAIFAFPIIGSLVYLGWYNKRMSS